MIVLLLIGCSDLHFGLAPLGGGIPDEPLPDVDSGSDSGTTDSGGDTGLIAGRGPEIAYRPHTVAETGVCGERTVPIVLSNRGGAPLEIRALTLAGAAAGNLPATPFTIASGDASEVDVAVSAGEGTLTVESDDADEPVVTIPLSATADTAPSLAIVAPADGAIATVGESIALSAQVADDTSGVQVSWTSDVDGLIASRRPDATGLASTTWSAVGRSAGTHTLTVAATDSCGNVTEQSLTLCQDAGYDATTVDSTSWDYAGSAAWDDIGWWLNLTVNKDEVGSAFQTSQSVSGDSVTVSTRFWFGAGSGTDGIALTALDSGRAVGYLGSGGGCLGYAADSSCPDAGTALPGWTVEIDTNEDRAWDATRSDHVAFVLNGDIRDPEAWAALPEMEANGWHDLAVTVSAPHVSVAIDGVTYIDQDITGLSAFPAYIGFSAATTTQAGTQRVDPPTVLGAACPRP